MRRFVPFLLLFALLFLVESTFAQGCSQCKLLSEQGAELDEDSFGSNINYGILYLMIIPYLLIMFLFRKHIIAFFKKFLSKKPTT
ncbi:MAG: hypothetical protein EP322_06575 [Bacteroidetes bacterium]|nr:MAG: hypothetical protein EP322_06575 [Bacteroidota bacterium]